MIRTVEQVESASLESLLHTWRFAPVGSIDNNVLEAIRVRMNTLRAESNDAWVAASKSVGWTI